MRASILSFAFFLTLVLGLVSSKPALAADGPVAGNKPSIKYRGRVLCPDGPLVGAVVQVPGTKLVAVTNGDGEFSITLPVRRAPWRLTASYAGYEDEKLTISADDRNVTMELATPTAIKAVGDEQLPSYLKNARREAKQTLSKL